MFMSKSKLSSSLNKIIIYRCIDKVFMEEQTEFDTEITCQHSYDKRCAKSLVTIYNSAQVVEHLFNKGSHGFPCLVNHELPPD